MKTSESRNIDRLVKQVIAIGCLLAGTFILGLRPAAAGTVLGDSVAQHEQSLEIQLLGATEFGVVQLFQHLLSKVENGTKAEPVGLHIEPDNPQACRAMWTVASNGEEAFELVRQLVAIIKELDPNVQNEVLYESPFIVGEGDIAQLKLAVPVVVGPGSAVFAIGNLGERPETVLTENHITTANRWSLMPGAGFD